MKKIAAAGLVFVSMSALAATAVWTGRQEFTQTVTGMPAFRCEYQYAGKHFWMVFQGSCPGTVEVQ